MAFARLGNLIGRTTSFLLCSFVASSYGLAQAQIGVSRGAATILVEPYAPNIVRVSMSLRKSDALAAPGYGITAQPNYADWKLSSDRSGDILRSSILTVTLSPQPDSERQSTEAEP